MIRISRPRKEKEKEKDRLFNKGVASFVHDDGTSTAINVIEEGLTTGCVDAIVRESLHLVQQLPQNDGKAACIPFSCHISRSVHSFIHSFILQFIHSAIHSFIHSAIHSAIHSFILQFIHSFILQFIHSSCKRKRGREKET